MLAQHAAYVEALESLGLEIHTLDALEEFPDAHFVEDTAVVTAELAVITRPGAAERRGEEASIEAALAGYRPIRRIEAPGAVDGGDVLEIDGHFFIGLSQRTNEAGADQLGRALEGVGATWSTVPVGDGLHFKSSVNELGGRRLIMCEAFEQMDAFAEYDRVVVPRDEEYAANSLWVNGTILIAAGFPRTRERIEDLGLPIIELEMSEARKMDGGLTCLSLRL